MSDMISRFEWVLKNRTNRALPGEDWNQRQWSLRAGLAGQHLSTILSRLRRKPKTTLEVTTIQALAEAADVPFAWLANGEGGPDDPRQKGEESERVRQAEMSRAQREAAAVEAARKEFADPDEDDGRTSTTLAAVIARRKDLTASTIRMLRSYRGEASEHLTEEQWDLFASQVQGMTRLVEMQAVPKPIVPTSTRKERYAATPFVRQAGLAQGFSKDFVDAWEARFHFDGEPDFETLYNCMRDDWCVLKGLPRRVKVRYPEPDEF